MYVDNQGRHLKTTRASQGRDEGIIKGMYLLRGRRTARSPHRLRPHHGPSAGRCSGDYGVRCEIYSATSYGELRREGLACDRRTRPPPHQIQKPYVETLLGAHHRRLSRT